MRKGFLIAWLCLTSVLFLISNVYPQTSKSSSGGGDNTPITKNTFVQLAQKVTPAVVSVLNMREFGVFGTKAQAGHGSGFIIDSKKGIVLTNNHVIDGHKSLAVSLNDNRSFKAKLIGTDPVFDVAVVQIENPPEDLKQVALGDSDKLSIGDWVVAMGFPGNLGYVVTSGNVVALGKELPIGKLQYENIEYRTSYILMDVLITNGNSGGPLFNLSGEVVGINTAGRNVGSLGATYKYAVPINTALSIKEKIIKDGKVIRAYFGILGTDINEELAASYNLSVDGLVKELELKEAKGIFIQGTKEGSAAESVGFIEGDVLIEFDNKKVGNLKDFRNIIEKLKPEQEIKLKYIHKGEEKIATVQLAELGGDKKSDKKEPSEEEDE